MPEQSLIDRLDVFRAWQTDRLRLLDKLHRWLHRQGLLTPEADGTIRNARRMLLDEKLTIAVVGEFSRGKTELINALFFADQGCRLLPSNPGRTTMCPTEIFCDPEKPPTIRLLPIETRGSDEDLASLRNEPSFWQERKLDADSPAVMAEQCAVLTETLSVSASQAAGYGLVPDSEIDDPQAVIDVPRWRLAQINLHHPLLQKGLRILDTPGLNAVGTEPELTYEMLPAAHAVLFVLGVDTGVTQSDLQVWREIARQSDTQETEKSLVVLNKTDTLWDELRSPHEIARLIIQQCAETARTLNVDKQRVFAASAQKALLAQIRRDEGLLQRSGIGSLQRHLSNLVSSNRKAILERNNTKMVIDTIDTISSVIDNRIRQQKQECRSLITLNNASGDAARKGLEETQSKLARYQSDINAYNLIIDDFRKRAHHVLAALDTTSFEISLDRIHERMKGAWTTNGLKNAMQTLFDEIDVRMDTVGRQLQIMRKKLRVIQRRFREDGRYIGRLSPMHSIVRYQVELGLLGEEAETFRNSRRIALMEQHFVVRHYFKTIVSRAKQVVQAAHDETRHWSMTAIAPFEDAVDQYRQSLSEQIRQLQETGQSRRTVQHRVSVLKHDISRLRIQAATLKTVRKALTDRRRLDNLVSEQQDRPGPVSRPPKDNAVSSSL